MQVPLLLITTQSGTLKTVSDVVSWVRLVRMLRLLPLLRSLVVLSLTVGLPNGQCLSVCCMHTTHHTAHLFHMMCSGLDLQQLSNDVVRCALPAVQCFQKPVFPGLRQGHHDRRMLRFMPSNALLGIHIMYMALFVSNLLACVWYYTAIAEGVSNSWLRSVGALFLDHKVMFNFQTYFHLSLTLKQARALFPVFL